MERIKLYTIVFLSLCCSIMWAEPHDKLILKDGSILEGYISVQRPGKDIIFMAEQATVYIPSSKVLTIENQDVELNSLSDGWKKWASTNPSLVKKMDKKEYLVLSDILFPEIDTAKEDTTTLESDSTVLGTKVVAEKYVNWNVVPRKVRILERGAVIKYLDCSPNLYYMSWDDIGMIKREKRSAMELTGLIDVIELRSGEKFEGQIIEQVPNKLIRLLKANGVIEVINTKQIATQRKVKLNKDQGLFEQSPLLDIIQTKDGNEVRGILIEQNYGNEKEGGYLLVQNERGDIQRKDNRNISKIRREKNMKYTPLSDVTIVGDEILINRKKAEEAILNQQENILIVDPESKATVLRTDSIDEKLIVELQENKSNGGFILLKLVRMEVKGKGTFHAFTYEDLVTRGMSPAETSVSVNKTLKLVYPVTKGNYILYQPQEKKAIYCIVE